MSPDAWRMVITELADCPGVAHSVYVAAAWPSRGESLLDMSDDGPPPAWMTIEEDTVRISASFDLFRQIFCADVDEQRAAAIFQRLQPQSLASFTALSTAPHRTHPTTYIVCEEDGVFPPAVQERLATSADHVERLASSHLPLLSMPDELAAVLGHLR